jgi:isopropylmalate/homocitrate/citramalate synthase
MVRMPQKVTIKDSTLREGLDTPHVEFSVEQRLKIVHLFDNAGIPEAEIVAPGKVLEDMKFAERLQSENLRIKTSGLVYAYSSKCREEIEASARNLDRFDILMPLSEKRRPYDPNTKIRDLLSILDYALGFQPDVGAGFPHAMQATPGLLLEISQAAVEKGAKRIVVYDTNGSADPFEVKHLIGSLKEKLDIPLCFHAHNDLGLATANSLSAIYAGAGILEATVNGLGDRAGNASLEQIAMCLHLKGIDTGIVLTDLKPLAETVAQESGIDISRLAPIVGDFVFQHKSPSHLEAPELFEAFDPGLLDLHRALVERKQD